MKFRVLCCLLLISCILVSSCSRKIEPCRITTPLFESNITFKDDFPAFPTNQTISKTANNSGISIQHMSSEIKIEPEPIVEIKPIFKTILQGELPTVPSKVEVIRKDESKTFEDVTWIPISKYSYQEVGNFTIMGTVRGTDISAKIFVTVLPTRELGFDIIRDDTYEKNVITVNNSDYSIPVELSDKIYNTLAIYQKKYGINAAFNVISLKDYTTIGYNADENFPVASTVKGPYALYCYKEIQKGNVSLDDILTYESRFWEVGSGILKNSKVGTKYTFRDVLHYTLNISDNSGYYMAIDHCGGSKGYNNMLNELGCQATSYKWGTFTPHDLSVIWNEIYNFSFTCEEGEFLLQELLNAKYNFIKDALGYEKIAHKSGFNAKSYDDAAIVFKNDKVNDYVVVIMTKATYSYSINGKFLAELAKEIDAIMQDLTIYQS